MLNSPGLFGLCVYKMWEGGWLSTEEETLEK